jgi:hypothetical protein
MCRRGVYHDAQAGTHRWLHQASGDRHRRFGLVESLLHGAPPDDGGRPIDATDQGVRGRPEQPGRRRQKSPVKIHQSGIRLHCLTDEG